MPEWLSLTKLLIAPLKGIVSLFRENKKINRQEDNDDIKKLVEKVEKIRLLACNYWKKSNAQHGKKKAISLQNDIITNFTELSTHINKLRINGIDCQSHFIRFKQAATGGTFQTKDRKANMDVSENLIHKQAQALIDNTHSIYKQKYRPSS
jgi:hypothetical protein